MLVVRSFEEAQETMALLRILAIGAEHIRAGGTQPLDDVLDRLAAGLDEDGTVRVPRPDAW